MRTRQPLGRGFRTHAKALDPDERRVRLPHEAEYGAEVGLLEVERLPRSFAVDAAPTRHHERALA